MGRGKAGLIDKIEKKSKKNKKLTNSYYDYDQLNCVSHQHGCHKGRLKAYILGELPAFVKVYRHALVKMCTLQALAEFCKQNAPYRTLTPSLFLAFSGCIDRRD